MGIESIKFTVLVLSGKGGVGKSTVSCQMALSFQELGFKVGLLDIDICGPSIPKMLGLTGKNISQGENGWIPIEYKKNNKQNLYVISIGFLLNNQDSAIIWRGPRKNAMIKQFLTDVDWGTLDYLLIDTPPGTSDEHISIVETLKELQNSVGAILVTTPQLISIGDVRREITFCNKGKINILGIVENMSGYVCKNCSECINIFSSGGGRSLAEYANVDFLVSISIEPKLARCCDLGINFIEEYKNSDAFNQIETLCKKICQKSSNSNSDFEWKNNK